MANEDKINNRITIDGYCLNTATFRCATLADAEAVCDVYLTSRKKLVVFAPLVHSDDEIRQVIRIGGAIVLQFQ